MKNYYIAYTHIYVYGWLINVLLEWRIGVRVHSFSNSAIYAAASLSQIASTVALVLCAKVQMRLVCVG